MSVTVIRTLVRPSITVDFQPELTLEEKTHMERGYIDTGKLISRTINISSDGLTATIIRIFADQSALDEFNKDPSFDARRAAVQEHISQNGINVTRRVI